MCGVNARAYSSNSKLNGNHTFTKSKCTVQGPAPALPDLASRRAAHNNNIRAALKELARARLLHTLCKHTKHTHARANSSSLE